VRGGGGFRRYGTGLHRHAGRYPRCVAGGVQAWRKRTATGAVLTGIALGLQEALEGRDRDEPPIVIDAPGDPPRLEPLQVFFDEDSPQHTFVVVRPWLAHS
jgi:hypothetical protein